MVGNFLMKNLGYFVKKMGTTIISQIIKLPNKMGWLKGKIEFLEFVLNPKDFLLLVRGMKDLLSFYYLRVLGDGELIDLSL